MNSSLSPRVTALQSLNLDFRESCGVEVGARDAKSRSKITPSLDIFSNQFLKT